MTCSPTRAQSTPTIIQNGAAADPTDRDRLLQIDLPHAFRVMLNKVADQLDEANVSSIAFIQQIPAHEMPNKKALPALQYLHKRGLFSWESTEQLKKLLQDAGRCDLATGLLQEYETLYYQCSAARAANLLQTSPPGMTPVQ